MNRQSHSGHMHNGGLGLSPLSEDEAHDLYLGVLEVLEQAGIRVEASDCIDVFADAGCKVDRENHLVRFPPAVVEDAIRAAPKRIRVCGRDASHDLIWEAGRPTFMPFLEGVATMDLDTQQVRNSTKQDIADICRLVEFLPEFDIANVAVGPRDMPTETASIHGFDAAVRNTTKGVFIALLSRHETETVVEMAQTVAGGPEELADRPTLVAAGGPVTPLYFHKTFTDSLMASARAGVPTAPGSDALVGATTPVTLAGTLVVGIAEQLAALVLVQACERGCPTLIGSANTGFDMRFGLATVGCPEMAILQAGYAQFARHLGLPAWTSGL